ncbi:hypothetical protein AB1L30_17945 [Bremerella sp. JC817]|uniref:hypothetical protein n=1 Tax=Bremerella sp. JC817 TaxID=3231756 RepID=UPI003457A722
MTKTPKLSKADAIRKHMVANPNASPGATAEALKKAGYKDVTPQYVSTIKSMDRRKANGPKQRGPLTADDLLQTKKFAESLGGFERASEAIEMLSTFQGLR